MKQESETGMNLTAYNVRLLENMDYKANVTLRSACLDRGHNERGYITHVLKF